MKQRIQLTESQLKNMIRQAIREALDEKGKSGKLANSFKSKEDMTQYRDLYAPNSSNSIIDTDGSLYDTEYSDNGVLGSGPYMDYIEHTFADGYDYCGDDDYNDYASEYNGALRKRLSTKGGQMSFDWDNQQKEYNDAIKKQHDRLEYDADRRFLDDINYEIGGKIWGDKARKDYVDTGDTTSLDAIEPYSRWLLSGNPNAVADRQWEEKYGYKPSRQPKMDRSKVINVIKKGN